MPLVRAYVRSDGTQVRQHSRWAAGGRREMAILAVVGLAVVGMGNGNVTLPNDGNSPRPRSTVQYPIRFPSPKGQR